MYVQMLLLPKCGRTQITLFRLDPPVAPPVNKAEQIHANPKLRKKHIFLKKTLKLRLKPTFQHVVIIRINNCVHILISRDVLVFFPHHLDNMNP